MSVHMEVLANMTRKGEKSPSYAGQQNDIQVHFDFPSKDDGKLPHDAFSAPLTVHCNE